MKLKNNFLIFKALLKRDIKIIISSFFSFLIDSIIFSSSFILLFGFFLPAFGMPREYSLPLFFGSVIITMISLSFTRMVSLKSDIEFKKNIDFHLILPISRSWLIFEYIVAFVIDILTSTLPALIIGILILNSSDIFALIYFIPIYLLSLFFIAILFLNAAFIFELRWLLANMWERILAPMIQLGCIIYIWLNLMKFSQFFGQLVLLNPLTYIVEGYRSAIYQTGYIPESFCFIMLLILTFVLLIFLKRSFYTCLDPV